MSGEWVPILLFIVIGIVVLGYFYWNHKNRADIMATVQKAIDGGGELSPELLMQLGAAVNPRIRDLRRGVIFLALGAATLLSSLFFDEPDILSGLRALAMFPLLLGSGFLLVWRLNRD